MADYNVKLKVDTSQHDAAMEKSAGQVNYYAKRVLSAKDKIMGMTKAIPALTLAVGGTTVAIKGLAEVLKSVDSGWDQVYRTMTTGTAIFDHFKISLTTADFSNFISGLDDITRSAKRAYDAVGDMDAVRLETSLPVAKIKAQMAELRSIVNDRNATIEERKNAQKELRNLIPILENIYARQAEVMTKAFKDSFLDKMGGAIDLETLEKAGINIRDYDPYTVLEDVVRLMEDEFVAGAGESNWQAAIDSLDRYFSDIRAQVLKEKQERIDSKTIDAEREMAQLNYNKASRAFDAIFKKIEAMRNIREDPSDNDRIDTKSEFIDLLNQIMNLNTNMYNDIKLLNMVSTRTLTETKSVGEARNKIKESIETSRTEEDLADAVSSLAEEVEIMYNQLGIMFDDKVDTRPAGDIYSDNQISSINQAGLDAIVEREEDLEYIGAIIAQQAEILDHAFAQISNSIVGTIGAINSLGSSLGNIFDSEEVTEFFNSIQEGVNVLGQMLNVYQSIIDTIELINTLKKAGIVLSNAQAAADVSAASASLTKTSADSGAAIAGATKSGAGIPFPWNLVAIAAGIAAVVGALSLIGKFANGGIVGGNSSIGDKMIARVNSGEMILNNRQQARLFSILDGSGRLNDNSATSGNVTFRISGGDLVGVLNNQEKKKSRVI